MVTKSNIFSKSLIGEQDYEFVKNQLVRGETKESIIIARIAEGIINAIGPADTHADVLEFHQNIDLQTAFEILSIDISDPLHSKDS